VISCNKSDIIDKQLQFFIVLYLTSQFGYFTFYLIIYVIFV